MIMTGQQLKNSILQEAIEGRLVPQDPNDEPASVLLERIRAEKARLVKEKKIKKDKNESRIYRTEDGHWMEHFEDKSREDVCIDEEIPFDIPSGWEWCRLGNIIKISSGDGLTSKEMDGGSIPVYGGNGITGYHSRFNIDKETVVIGRVGYYCGSVHVTPAKAWITDNAFITEYPINFINRDFLVFSLKHMKLGRDNNATAQPVVSGKKIYPLLFPLPPLAEQYRIVEKIESLLPKVEAYGKAQEELEKLNEALPEQLKRSILQEAIEGRLIPQDPNDEPASVLLERIRAEKVRLVKEKKIKKDKNESRIYRTEDGHWMEHFEDKNREDVCIDEEIPFDLPNGWEWCRFGNIQYLLTDGTHSRPQYVENGVPFLSVKDISSGKISFDNVKYISLEEHEKLTKGCNPQQGDLLISKVGTTGIPVIVDTKRKFSLFVSVALVKFFKEYINSSFLLLQINSPLVQEQVKRDTRGVGNKNWVLSAIYNTLLILPPLAEQHRIVEKIESLLPKIEKLKVNQ